MFNCWIVIMMFLLAIWLVIMMFLLSIAISTVKHCSYFLPVYSMHEIIME